MSGIKDRFTLLVISFWIVGLVVTAPTTPAQKTVASDAIQRARVALNAGDGATAISVLKSLLREDPGATEALELLVKAYHQAGRFDKAQATAETVLRVFPARHATRLWLAQFLEGRRSFADAERHYALVLRHADTTPELARQSRLGLGRVFLERDEPEKALAVIAPLLESDPDDVVTQLEIRALRSSGRLDAAIAAARGSGAGTPAARKRLASLLHEHGLHAYQNHDLVTARRSLEESVSLGAKLQVRLDLSRVLQRQNRPEEALRLLRQTARDSAYRADVVEALVEALCAAGLATEALDAVNKLLEHDPSSGPARLLELRCLHVLKRDPEARRRLEALAASRERDPDGQAAMFRAVRDLDRPEVCVDALLAWRVRPAPGNEAAWIDLLGKAGHRARKAGDSDQARRFLCEALRLAPEDPTIRRELGWVEFAADHHDEALRLWGPVLAASDPSPLLLTAAARSHHASGRLDDALGCARRAVAAAPDASGIRGLHWSLLDEAGLVDELVEAISPERVKDLTAGEAAALSRILTRRRDDPAVRAVIDAWLKTGRNDARIAHVAARILRDDARAARERGDLKHATALAGQAVALAPDAAWAHRDLASHLAASGAHDAALKARREAVRLEPDHTRSRVQLVVALRAAGRLEEARAVVEAAPFATSTDPAFRLAAIEVDLASGRPREAEKRARALIEDAGKRGDRAGEAVKRAWDLLVTALLKAKDFKGAIETLERRIQARPNDAAVLNRYRATCAWIEDGDRYTRFLESVYRAFPREPAVCSALGGYHFERQEYEKAIPYLTRYVALRPKDLRHLHLLGDAQLNCGNMEAARDAYGRVLAISPTAKWAKLELANLELKTGNHARAIEICDEILAENPWLQPSRWTKVKAHLERGDHEAALKTWDSMYGFLVDEAEHYLMRTRILDGAERFSEAESELERILARCATGVLPILVYHGVSDDMQPATIHVDRFREHMLALHDAGYVAVGQKEVREWLNEKRKLPDRAVMITFDDARLDNLVYADPVLEEVGFKATECVPTARIESRRSYHLSWQDLRDMVASGRWEIAAHGHEAHDRIPTGPEGESSPYLAACRWVADERRLETREEFVARIDTDYQRAQRALRGHLGLEHVDYYSFTFNEFGQKEISNAPWIFEINDRAMRKHFGHGFHQSGGTYNIRSEDGNPYMSRFTVPSNWSGEALVEHLRRSHPVALTHLELGRLYSWMGDYNDAFAHLDLAAEAGAEESDVLRARARAQMWQGDAVSASLTFRRLVDVDPGEVRDIEALEKIERDRRPSAEFWVDLWWDSQDRAIFGQTLRGELEADSRLRLFAEMRHARYYEKNYDDVPAWIPKLGAVVSLDGPTELTAALGYAFLDGANNQIEYDASVTWQGVDRLAFVGDVAGGPVQTAAAIHDGVRLDAQSVMGRYQWTPDDQFVLSLRTGFYSDDNFRFTTRFRYAHRFTKDPAFRFGFVGDYDNTRESRAQYFTPDNQLRGIIYGQFDQTVDEKFTISARLGGGWGVEDGKGEFVGQGHLRFRWRLAENLEWFGHAAHQRNPGYYATLLTTGLDLRF